MSGWVAIFSGLALALWAMSRPETGRVVVVGDSLGVGIGAALKRLGVEAKTDATIGTTTSWWAQGSRWEEAIAGFSVAVVSLGSNDIAQNKTPTATMRELQKRAEALGVRLLWVVPETRLWQKSTIIFPGQTVRLAGASEAADGVHLTKDGYDHAANLVARRLGLR